METFENQCVDCGLPCLVYCPYKNVRVVYCDSCGSDNAEYSIDGADYCDKCARKFLLDSFDDLSIYEQAEALQLDIATIE